MSTNDANESAMPLTLARPDQSEKELTAFRELADTVSRHLLRIQYGTSDDEKELVAFDGDTYDAEAVALTLDRTKGLERFIVRVMSESSAIQKQATPFQAASTRN
jgi:uncharacterized membrane protein